jgi:hypothetical protein
MSTVTMADYDAFREEVARLEAAGWKVVPKEEPEYGGLITVARNAQEQGYPIHIATRTTCAEHLEKGDDKRADFAFGQPARPADAALREGRIREALWMLHGHDFIYGDDGEMQCNWSLHVADFKRDPMDKLLYHCDEARLAALAQQPTPAEGA